MTRPLQLKTVTAAILSLSLSACGSEQGALAAPPCVNSGGSTCVLPIGYVFSVDPRTLSHFVVVTTGYIRPIPARAPGDVRYALYPSKEMALHARAEYRIELIVDDLNDLDDLIFEDGSFVQVEGRFEDGRRDASTWASMRLTRAQEDGEFPFGSVTPGVPQVVPPPPPPPEKGNNG